MSNGAYEYIGPVDEEFTLTAKPDAGVSDSTESLVHQLRNDPRVDAIVVVPPEKYGLEEFLTDSEVQGSGGNANKHNGTGV